MSVYGYYFVFKNYKAEIPLLTIERKPGVFDDEQAQHLLERESRMFVLYTNEGSTRTIKPRNDE